MSDTAPATDAPVKQTNEERRRDKLQKQAARAHEWRVQVWAQQTLRLDRINAELAAMEFPPVVPWEPDFADREMLKHYAEMSITPR